MRRTQIICTLGPASEKPETLRQLVHEGANVFRLNMSHAPHDWVRQIVPRIRAIAKELGVIVGILMDTQGPAIRIDGLIRAMREQSPLEVTGTDGRVALRCSLAALRSIASGQIVQIKAAN